MLDAVLRRQPPERLLQVVHMEGGGGAGGGHLVRVDQLEHESGDLRLLEQGLQEVSGTFALSRSDDGFGQYSGTMVSNSKVRTSMGSASLRPPI